MSYDKILNEWLFPTSAAAVAPNDGANLPRAGRLYVGGTGNVRVLTIDDNDVTFTGVPAGTVLPVLVKRVYSTSTTATNMVVSYPKNA